MRSKIGSFIGAIALLAGVGVVNASVVAAATSLTWTGAGANANWSTPANWSPAQAPAAGDSLTFPPGASRLTSNNDLPADSSFGGITLTGSGYTLTGNSLRSSVMSEASNQTLNNTVALPITLGGISAGAGVLNVTSPVTVISQQVFIVVSFGQVVVSGAISGGGSLLIDNHYDGKVVFNGSNTVALATVDSGTLVVNGSHSGRVDVLGSQFGPGILLGSGTLGPLNVGTAKPSDTSSFPANSVSPGDPVGVLHSGDFTLGYFSSLNIDGTGAGSGHFDQLAVTGTVTLYGELSVDLTFRPAVGQALEIVDNDGTDAIVGNFKGLPEGAAVGGNGSFFKITYKGGDGNDVVLTAVAPPPVSILAAPGSGGGPNVKSFGGRSLSFLAGGGSGGASVAAGNVQGGQLDDIVVGSGAGVPSLVTVYNADGSPSGRSFSPYGDGFMGGVNVAVADVDGDGVDEIVTGAGPGGGPNVKEFRADGTVLRSFFAYDSGFHGGVKVAGGDVNGDGLDDIITGPGPGGGPNVKALSADGRNQLATFSAYDDGFRGGVNVAAADIDGDGKSEIVTGAGPGGGPHVRVFSGSTPIGVGFFAYDQAFVGGVSVGSLPDFAVQRDDIVTGAGPGGGPNVKAFTPSGGPLASFFAYDPAFAGGVNVAGAVLNNPQ